MAYLNSILKQCGIGFPCGPLIEDPLVDHKILDEFSAVSIRSEIHTNREIFLCSVHDE